MAKPVGNGSGNSTSYKSKTYEVSVTPTGTGTEEDPFTFVYLWKQGGNTVSPPPANLGASNDFLYIDASLDMLDGSDNGFYDNAYSALAMNGGKGADQLIFKEDDIEIDDSFFSALASFEDVKLADGVGSEIRLGFHALETGITSVSGGNGADEISFDNSYDTTNVTVKGGGGADKLETAGGNDVLSGDLGPDQMSGGGGNDTYVVDNAGDDVIENADEGTDLVQSSISYALATNVENLTLTGSSDINATGNDLDNEITGNSGENYLAGGTGNDTLTGGSGIDHFMFDTALDGTNNVDTITDFTSGEDDIGLDSDIFVGLNLVAEADFFDYIKYDSVTGLLSFDADGTDPGAAIDFAQLGDTTHPGSVAYADFYFIT